MSKITSTNKDSFKSWLKTYKGSFGSNHIVKDYMGMVKVFLTSSSGISTIKPDQPVNIVFWDYDETIDLTGSLIEGEYYYFPAISNDKVKIKNGTSSTTTLYFDTDGKWTGKALDSVTTVGASKFKVVGLGGTLVQTQVSPTYAISANTTSANEGDTVTFTVTTTNVADGDSINWNTIGTVSSSDFTDNTSTGTVQINSNTATITRTLKNDMSVGEGVENFQIQLYSGSTTFATSQSIAVADTSAATYNVSGATTVIEGNTVTYTVNTTGVPDGTTLYYRHNRSSDATPSSGNFTINSNTASFTITFTQDYRVESDETLTMDIKIGGTYGTTVATMNTVISDKSFTIALTPAATTINESTTATSNIIINVTTTDVADGTTFRAYPVASGSSTITYGSGGDFDNSYYTFTVNNNAATVNIPVSRDGRTEGTEQVIVQVRDASNSNVIASTPAITINDTSYIGKNFANKTFGPINVNRDNGSTSNVSDWYTICGLDSLPDGSKIAIFIDTSGSMTMSTIQASYDQLIAKLQARSMDVITVQNSQEDWITPFDQILT